MRLKIAAVATRARRQVRLLATAIFAVIVLALGVVMMRQPAPSPITIRGTHSLVVTVGPLPTLQPIIPGRDRSSR